MPEVVEVTLTALWLNERLSGKQINKITVLGGRYSRHDLKGMDFINTYKPIINRIDSKGKFLWFETLGTNNKFYYILNRFGLEGEWGFKKQEHSGIQFTIKDDGKELNLYFTDSRNFGTIEIVDNKESLNKELIKLAPDVLKTQFTHEDFYDRIKKYVTEKTGTINKSKGKKEVIKVLMDQSALYSGMGNYLAVEILYKCKMSPHKKIIDIYNDKKLAYILADSIKYVVKMSFLNANIGYLEHLDPDMASFISNLRNKIRTDKNNIYNFHPDVTLDKDDKFTFKVYRQKFDPLGNPVLADKIIKGRTTYWSPNVQV